jgi:hypothetical protein
MQYSEVASSPGDCFGYDMAFASSLSKYKHDAVLFAQSAFCQRQCPRTCMPSGLLHDTLQAAKQLRLRRAQDAWAWEIRGRVSSGRDSVDDSSRGTALNFYS